MLSQKLHLDGSEKSMIPIIKSNVSNFSFNDNKKLVSIEEFSCGTGISDLTIFTVDDKILAQRQKSNKKPITSKNQIQVLLTLLDNKPLILPEIIERVSFNSKHTVLKILKQLVEANIVTVNEGEYRASHSIAESTSENVIAIEAKISDWKSGVRQAMRYKEYANYSYLAIYEEHIPACIGNIEVFKKLGIGLIGVSNEGIKWHIQASLSNVTTVENKILAFERFYSIIDERYESFVAWNGFSTN